MVTGEEMVRGETGETDMVLYSTCTCTEMHAPPSAPGISSSVTRVGPPQEVSTNVIVEQMGCLAFPVFGCMT